MAARVPLLILLTLPSSQLVLVVFFDETALSGKNHRQAERPTHIVPFGQAILLVCRENEGRWIAHLKACRIHFESVAFVNRDRGPAGTGADYPL